MPHTNNPLAKARKANRAGRKPKFLLKQKLASKGTVAEGLDSATEIKEDVEAREVKVQLIREFHTIEKRLAATKDPVERQELIKKRDQLGGLDKYQMASIHGSDKTRGGESSKWCVTQLKELKVGVDKGKQKQAIKVEPTMGPDGKKIWPKVEREKLRLLDVGAIAGSSYSAHPWIDATYIDLNPQAAHVLKYDFFDYPSSTDGRLFDVVALSLVLNFEGSLTRRAEMLRRAHLYLKPQGLMYLVLPLPCLTNSRYMNHQRMESILLSTGWKQVRQHDSAKLTYWLCKRVESDGLSWKREQVRGGIQRNNFCIVVTEPGQEGGQETEPSPPSAGETLSAGSGEPIEAETNQADEEEEWGGIEEFDEEAEWAGIADE